MRLAPVPPDRLMTPILADAPVKDPCSCIKNFSYGGSSSSRTNNNVCIVQQESHLTHCKLPHSHHPDGHIHELIGNKSPDQETYHAIEQIKGSQPYGLVFVIKALQHKIFVCLNRFRKEGYSQCYCFRPPLMQQQHPALQEERGLL
ncbi:hypothetical protein E2C01_005849 [Portunus trituberculatus]|uniref:Uncharacterized protein n=1 Tax=Portunus trituberculatus TaxID=210409 RepID=A0A5B7CUN1_PORTR|nr:hypothetical protein [Portunus trituberculatus]